MTQREPPSVLVVAHDSGSGSRIATMLEEAGIAVTAAEGGAAALAAASRKRYNLAIVAAGPAGWPDVAGLAEAIRARHPTLELLSISDTAIGPTGAGGAEPRRRFVGCVRERLLRCGTAAGTGDEAEAVIAVAQIACLHRRREAARASGAHRLADELRRQIDRVAGRHQGRLPH
ncbi:MAG TPA: hypothetical protein VND87_00140 [Stellaceae bacterium]|nr:hypothetical protein [Stellaceae bacterium]